MATAKEFISRVDGINGVASCLLVRKTGELLGHTFDQPGQYQELIAYAMRCSAGIQDAVGVSCCKHISFCRSGKENFYLFCIGGFLLGVLQRADSSAPDMLDAVYRLIKQVSSGERATP